MGLLTKMTGLFKGGQGTKAATSLNPTDDYFNAPSGESQSSHDGAETVIAEPKPAKSPPMPTAPVEVVADLAGLSSHPKRSKQEVIEELQRNYREVVQLIGRVNEHMDQADDRSKTIVELAQRALEANQRLPETVALAIEKAQAHQVDALQAIAQAHEQGTERLDTSIARVGIQMEVASESHEQLCDTMASFRETMYEVSVTSTRTADALDASMAQKSAADERIAHMVVQNQRWMIGALGGIMILAGSAFVLAVVALMKM